MPVLGVLLLPVLAARMENVMVFHHGLYRDETAAMSDWHMPAAHWLESWGDARSWDGSAHIAQPLIKPIAGGMSAIELCAALLGREGDARAEVRATFDAMGLAGTDILESAGEASLG